MGTTLDNRRAVFVDCETRSRADLKICGTSRYARHESTEVLCVAYWHVGLDDVAIWRPGLPVPDVLLSPAHDVQFCAHNAGFEQAIFEHVLRKHGFAPIAPHRWHCTAAMCGHAGLQQALSKITKQLDLGEFGKDNAGHLNMLRLCKPVRGQLDAYGIIQGGDYDNDPERHAKNEAYCLAGGTLVVTDRGLVPVEHVNRFDRVWDGVEWVRQGGAVGRGAQETISVFGVRATPDHKFLTTSGWGRAWSCDAKTQADARVPVQTWGGALWVQARYEPEPGLPYLDQYVRTLPQAYGEGLRAIRGARYPRVQAVARVVCQFLGRHGERVFRWGANRPDRQLRGLQAWQLLMGNAEATGEQYQDECCGRDRVGAVDGRATGRASRYQGGYTETQIFSRGPDATSDPSGRRFPAAEVFDLLNCGPRRRFAVFGRDGFVLAHNCCQDVRAEVRTAHLAPPLPDRERRIWLLHRKIAERGVPVDLALCRGAARIADIESQTRLAEFRELTGADSPDCRAVLLAFIAARGVHLCTHPGGDPANDPDAKPNLREATVTALLPTISEPAVKRALELRQLLASAAAKKFQAVLNWADYDGVGRDTFKYYGAGPGRWSGRGPQLQNLKKPHKRFKPLIAEALPLIIAGDYRAVAELSGGDVLGLLGSCVRQIPLAPDGQQFIVSDFAGIEARVLAWLAGCDALLDIYRRGDDPYAAMACDIQGCTLQDIYAYAPDGSIQRDEHGEKVYIDGGKQIRDMGKPPFLGAGYQMSGGKLEITSKKAGIPLEPGGGNVCVEAYRTKFPEVPAFWRAIEDAARFCVKTGRPVAHPKFRFRIQGPWLVMLLPSGRELFYYNARFAPSQRFNRDELVYDSPRGLKQLYGGLLTENIDQAVSRDLLCDAMIRMDACGIDLCMHCHDETVSLCGADDASTPRLVHALMKQVEPWAEGIPVDAETKTGVRYNK